MARPKKLNWDFTEVCKHLSKKDKKVLVLFERYGALELHYGGRYFESLVKAITSQQVSVAAAATIYKRLEEGVGGIMEAEVVARCSAEEIRRFGLSRQKAGYIYDLAHHFVNDPTRFEHLDKFTDEEVQASLVQIKGIGKWTAQMFLMFTLGRPDVFAPDDLGLRNAMVACYKLNEVPGKAEMEKRAKAWSPYRTIVSRYLWHSLHNSPD